MANNFKKATYSHIEDNRIFFEGRSLKNAVIDEHTFPEEISEVFLSSMEDINVIINVGQHTMPINYVVMPNTRGKIIHLLAEEVQVFNRIYRLEEGVDIDFATPDFNRTNRQFNVQVELVGQNARTNWLLSSLVDQQHSKVYDVSFLHKHGHTFADMQNYGVIIDDSKLDFSGTSAIFENMTRAETHQTAKIIIFDDKAQAKADPILVIHHNDVAASHAATVGKVNSDHLYYMQSRGISEIETKRLITKGYLEPVIKYVDDEDLARRLTNNLEEAL